MANKSMFCMLFECVLCSPRLTTSRQAVRHLYIMLVKVAYYASSIAFFLAKLC